MITEINKAEKLYINSKKKLMVYNFENSSIMSIVENEKLTNS
jgi:hypothetical protein